MSFQASYLIFAVILLKCLFKSRISPRLSYALWILPAIRLLIPYSFNFTKIYTGNSDSTGVNQITYQLSNNIITNSMSSFSSAINTLFVNANNDAVTGSFSKINGSIRLETVIFAIWFTGTIILFVYLLTTNIVFYYHVRNSTQIIDRSKALTVYLMKNITSPCLYGILRPKILVNEAALKDDETYDSVCSHELAHYKSGDHIWTLLRCVCCLIYWFNPLIWIAARCIKNDCELACDYTVIKDYTKEQREKYGLALIHIVSFGNTENTVHQKAVQMGSNSHFIKNRITHIRNRPKPYRYASILALLTIVILFVLCGFSNQVIVKDLFSSDFLAKTITNAISNPPVDTVELDNGTTINEYSVEGCNDSLFVSINTDSSLLFEYYETVNNIFYSRRIDAHNLDSYSMLSILSQDKFEVIIIK
jgi:beta-lactamase regulating signal transducer with metallopeptidase domain